MDRHILLLHIGTPKTGSTALQLFLYENAEILKNYGWCYPDFRKIISPNLANFTGYASNGSPLYRSEREIEPKSEGWRLLWNHLKSKLEKYNVILSAEEIFTWNPEELIEEVKKEYGYLKVIVYLRRQDLFTESGWNEDIKGLCYTKRFSDSSEDWIKPNYYLNPLSKIRELVGEENLIVRPYEKVQYRGDKNNIFSDFLYAIGIEPVWNDFRETGKVNERLYGNYLEMKRVFNTLKDMNPDIPIEKYGKYFQWLSRSMPDDKKKVGGYFSSKEDRENYLKKFEEENRIIAQQFVHNDEGILFYDENMDIPYIAQPSASELEEDIIKLFGMVLCTEMEQLKQKIDCQNQYSKKLAEGFINRLKGDRKIAYFGAGYQCERLLSEYGLKVEVIIDNDKKKAGKEIHNISVSLPGEIFNWKDLFIIITCVDADEIVNQIESLGVSKEDYLLAKEFLY